MMTNSLSAKVSELTEVDIYRALTIEHPMISKRNRTPLRTPPLIDFYNQAKLFIALRHSFYIEESTGEGKTMMMRFLRETLPRDLGDLRVIHYRRDNRDEPSLGGFFKGFLERMGHPIVSGSPYDLSERLIRNILELALRTQWRYIVLIIDEAQAMEVSDFGFVKDLNNELEEEGIDFSFIACGEAPFLGELIKKIDPDGRNAYCDRYFRHRLRLRGYTKDSLGELLRAVDRTRWPGEQDQTYTEFWFPLAYATGFRLETLTTELWEAFSHVGLVRSNENGKHDPFECGTVLSRRIFETLSYLAFFMMKDDGPNYRIPNRNIVEAACFVALKVVEDNESKN
ncbi:ATP-binding protein [Cupriavidus necator]